MTASTGAWSPDELDGKTKMGQCVRRWLERRVAVSGAYTFYLPAHETPSQAAYWGELQKAVYMVPWGAGVRVIDGNEDGNFAQLMVMPTPVSAEAYMCTLDDLIEAVVASIEATGPSSPWPQWREGVVTCRCIPAFLLSAIACAPPGEVCRLFPKMHEPYWLFGGTRANGALPTEALAHLVRKLAAVADVGAWMHRACLPGRGSALPEVPPPDAAVDADAPGFGDLFVARVVELVPERVRTGVQWAEAVWVVRRGLAFLDDRMAALVPFRDVYATVVGYSPAPPDSTGAIRPDIRTVLLSPRVTAMDLRGTYGSTVPQQKTGCDAGLMAIRRMASPRLDKTTLENYVQTPPGLVVPVPHALLQQMREGANLFMLYALPPPPKCGHGLFNYAKLTRMFLYGTPPEVAWALRTLRVFHVASAPEAVIAAVKIPAAPEITFLRSTVMHIMRALIPPLSIPVDLAPLNGSSAAPPGARAAGGVAVNNTNAADDDDDDDDDDDSESGSDSTHVIDDPGLLLERDDMEEKAQLLRVWTMLLMPETGVCYPARDSPGQTTTKALLDQMIAGPSGPSAALRRCLATDERSALLPLTALFVVMLMGMGRIGRRDVLAILDEFKLVDARSTGQRARHSSGCENLMAYHSSAARWIIPDSPRDAAPPQDLHPCENLVMYLFFAMDEAFYGLDGATLPAFHKTNFGPMIKRPPLWDITFPIYYEFNGGCSGLVYEDAGLTMMRTGDMFEPVIDTDKAVEYYNTPDGDGPGGESRVAGTMHPSVLYGCDPAFVSRVIDDAEFDRTDAIAAMNASVRTVSEFEREVDRTLAAQARPVPITGMKRPHD